MAFLWISLGIVGFALWAIVDSLRKCRKEYKEKVVRNRELFLKKIDLETSIILMRQSFELERELFSKTLHDEVGNSLASLKLMVDALGRTRYAGDFDLLLSMKKELDRSLYVVRNITKDVYPHSLKKYGLGFAIKELCDRLSNPRLTKIVLTETGESVRLPHDHELVLYRALQELIGNAMKHSNSWQITISLTWSDIDLIAAVVDNGSSYATWKENSGGMGLKSIRSSLKAIDASIFFNQERPGFKAEIVHPIYNGAYQDLHS